MRGRREEAMTAFLSRKDCTALLREKIKERVEEDLKADT
jgi:hypothetical protein